MRYRWMLRWDHPRVCGEKQEHRGATAEEQGSPPRMRGKASTYTLLVNTGGITPAYAGKSRHLYSFVTDCGDHPRVCGEKISFFFTGCSPIGSPPRMRGKVPGRNSRKTRTRDRPRVCGEKLLPRAVLGPASGSPPRMRGKVRPCVTHTPTVRITPAYAGKRDLPLICRNHFRDHPRVCGEKGRAFMKKTESRGSPPRMRGKVGRFPDVPAVEGITPAYAGKSLLCLYSPPCYKDHPRVCGEKGNSMLA